MTRWHLIAYLPIHLGCAMLSYAMIFAVFQRKYGFIANEDYWWGDFGIAAISGVLFGPLGLIASTIVVLDQGFYGFKLW